MEHHGHLQLEPGVRGRLLKMSAATIDRSLREAREKAGGRHRRRATPSALRQSIPVRTFSDWNDPPPGFFEADFVAHSGPRTSGSFVQTLVLTDIATGWTEFLPLLVRDKNLLTEALTNLRTRLPFVMLGFDTDNDSVFMNETVRDYCEANGITFTRCRPYRKNDQAWVEQKNGAIIRRVVGYQRFEGMAAAVELSKLYASLRLFVNCYQPSFKLAEKKREGALVRKRYHPPMTPLRRLLDDPRTDTTTRHQAETFGAEVDPVRLLQDIREQQRKLMNIADTSPGHNTSPGSPSSLNVFLDSLKTAWKEGDPNPVAQPKPKVPRGRRRPDPLAAVTEQIQSWFAAEPWRTASELLQRLKAECPNVCDDRQLRTLQRRLKIMRRDSALNMILVEANPGIPRGSELKTGSSPARS